MVGEKGGGAVNGAGQHRTDQDDEDRVKGGLFRERPPVADPDEGKPHDEDEDSANRDVEHGQLGCFPIGTEKGEEEILERVHENASPGGGAARVSIWRLWSFLDGTRACRLQCLPALARESIAWHKSKPRAPPRRAMFSLCQTCRRLFPLPMPRWSVTFFGNATKKK
jgi:hypothetical protein